MQNEILSKGESLFKGKLSSKGELLSVGELAKDMDITVRTLQYYDKEGILKPSALSEGGRRLYSKKDKVKLHQILSLKHLGFPLEEITKMMISLDSPEEVALVLKKQHQLVKEQIQSLESALLAIDGLQEEVLRMNTVDFAKYADIISLLKTGNEYYWAWKLFDQDLSTHIRERFGKEPEKGIWMMTTYQEVLSEAVELKNSEEAPDSEKSIKLAEKWWNMVMEFTGGDLSFLPQLMKFNESKEEWNKDMAMKQKQVDEYIGLALQAYFSKSGLEIPMMEVQSGNGN